jgi:hypothetical protein
MADNKTKPTKVSVTGFLEKQARPEQLADCQELVKIFKALTGKAPKMWGPSIVGFGSYHYVYPSGREGDAPLLGFAPRGRELALYVLGCQVAKSQLSKLGKRLRLRRSASSTADRDPRRPRGRASAGSGA